MNYFALKTHLNEKVLGEYPQIKEYIHHCNIDEEPNFIDKFFFEKIEIQPVLSNVVLNANANQTDFIDTFGSIGFNFGYLISDRFKQILDNFKCYGIQFFKTYVIQNDKNIANYWQTNLYDFPFQHIDFLKTNFILKDRDSNRNLITELINFNNIDEFNLFISTIRYPKMISVKNLSFNESMDLDFFSLRFVDGAQKGIVSESLKKELEDAGCTGIEFHAIELS